MIDLTGWTPHDGSVNDDPPPEALKGDIRVVIRGRPEGAVNGGPRESGPAPASAFVWRHDPAFPAGDLIGFRRADDDSPHVSYPRVRRDV